MPRKFVSQMAYLAMKRELSRTGYKPLVSSKLPADGGEAVMSAMAAEITKSSKAFLRKLEQLAKANLDANESVRTGLLQKAVAAKVETYEERIKTEDGETRKTFGIWGGLGINRAVEGRDEDGSHIWPLKYAHLVEFGHAKGNNKRGDGAPPKPFMRKALADVGGIPAIERMFADAAKKGLEKGARAYGNAG